MKSKSFMSLAGVTAVVVIAAIVAVTQTQRATISFSGDQEAAFPGLAEKLNDIASLGIVSAEAKFHVVRTKTGWGLKERDNYAVSFGKVKEGLVGLSELKLLESKTADPERHARLQVEAPGGKDTKSIGFEIKDGAGKVLAAGIIGKRRVGLFGTGGPGTYLRKDAEKQSWLARGAVELGDEPNDWMVRDIVNFEAEEISRAVIRQPEGAEIVVSKEKAADTAFKITGVPKGRKLKDKDEPKNLAGGLWRLSFEDVKLAKAIPFPEKLNIAEYESFGGVRVRVEMTFVDKTVWGRFSASVAETLTDAAARKKAEKRAKEINARVTGWVYELSAGEGEKLTTKIEDILEKPKRS